jgi:hypothetical protein
MSQKQIGDLFFALWVVFNKINYTPKEGIVPTLAVKYAKWLVELGIDGLEVSCGKESSRRFTEDGQHSIDEGERFFRTKFKLTWASISMMRISTKPTDQYSSGRSEI